MRSVLILPLLATLVLATPAFAQDDTAGVTNYPPAYFSANQPSTALDMVA